MQAPQIQVRLTGHQWGFPTDKKLENYVFSVFQFFYQRVSACEHKKYIFVLLSISPLKYTEKHVFFKKKLSKCIFPSQSTSRKVIFFKEKHVFPETPFKYSILFCSKMSKNMKPP